MAQKYTRKSVLKNLLLFFRKKTWVTESLFYFCDVEIILHHIEKLLACNDHAVVPGLGGFVVQHESARISGQQILPPTATISFNPLISHTDGMLAVEISRELRINYREATKMIEKEVEQFLNQLRKKKKLSFGQIGTFQMETDKLLIFIPAEKASFLPANFAMHRISLKAKSAHQSKDIVFTLSARNLMKYAAIFVTLVALLFSSDINDATHISRADFHTLNKVDLPEITVMAEVISPDEVPTSTVLPATEQFLFKIVVAAFQSEETALAYCNQLMAQDYPESEVLYATNNSKVSIRSFSDLVSAVNFMEQIRNQDARFPEAWVMRTKSTPNN